MADPSNSVLVLGAGELGTFVLHSLAKHPARGNTIVTVLLRQSTIDTQDPKKRRQIDELRVLGIRCLPGDTEAETEDQLAHKFASFGTVIVCTGFSSPPGTQLKFAKAAIAAKVGRYLPWQYGIDYDAIGRDSAQDLFTEQLDVRDLLRAQTSTSWVIVSTGLFMSFLFEDFFGVVSADRRTARALGSWENRVTVTDASDIGRMVAEVVLVESNITSQVVYIAGQTVSYSEIAQCVEEVSSGSIKKELWTVEKLEEDLREEPENGVKKYRIVFAQGRGTAWDMTRTLNHARNIPLLDIRSWLKSH
jgi:hypothetical protein